MIALLWTFGPFLAGAGASELDRRWNTDIGFWAIMLVLCVWGARVLWR